MNMKQLIHGTRLALSFSLLGALVAGVFLGGFEMDFRPYGAAIGGTVGVIYQLLNSV